MTAEVLSIPLSRVYSVATFFKAFSLKPRGRHGIHVCMGTACHVRGAEKVLDRFQTELCACAGETTPDMKFTLETVNCVGACALGPVVVVDGEYEGQVTAEKVKSIIEGCK
jgi:NADH-quinone oxidoreductase subunit E